MKEDESIGAGKLNTVGEEERNSPQSKWTVENRRRDRQILQNVQLIWLQDDTDGCDTITQLRCIVNIIDTFIDRDECIDFLTDIYNENVCMIISDELCQDVVPLIHTITQLQTILIFDKNKTHHDQWTDNYPKVKGVFSEIPSIRTALQQVARQYLRENLDQLDPSFMYTQLFKEIVLSIEFKQEHFRKFIDFCRATSADNESRLNNVDRLERDYREHAPIWWYTFEGFLYPMLNRALRVMDVNLILQLGFFIGDLHRQIGQLHEEQFGDRNSSRIFKVYRGQGMSKEDFEQMMKTKGGLISFNNFLSTSRDRGLPLFFAESNQLNPDLVGILFVMTIDASQSSTPFASVDRLSQFEGEEEVLFSMHTVFRILEIKSLDESNRLFEVELTLTSDNDRDLLVLTERMRTEIEGPTGWHRLGRLLLELQQTEIAQEVYETFLDQTMNEDRRAPVYLSLGSIKFDQGKYDEAICFFEKSAEIYQRIFSLNHPALVAYYNNIANVYYNMGEYSKALSLHEKVLEIWQQSLPPNHLDLAIPYNNIANVYRGMGEYFKSISANEKALEIRQQSLPPNHPDLAMSYNNIGNIYDNMGEYSKALSSHQKALEIRQKSLPSNHPDLAASYNNIGLAYQNMGEYSKALSSHKIALAIRQKSLPPNHPELAGSHNNIGNAHYSMGEYSKALLSYESALQIEQQSLSSNHPQLAMSHNNCGLVYLALDDYSKALYSHEKALEIRQQSLPQNHPDIAASYNNIGNVYYRMHEYFKALSCHEKALEIRQHSLPPNHPDLALSYSNIGSMYRNVNEYSKALASHQKALEIRQQCLPSNHPDLAASHNNIGLVYQNMGEYSKALLNHEKTLEIRQQLLASNDPQLATSYNNIGLVCYKLGEYSKALSSHEKALEIQQQSLPAHDPDLAKSYIARSVVYNRIREHAEACQLYEKALRIREDCLLGFYIGAVVPYNHTGDMKFPVYEQWKALLFWQLTVDIAEYSLPPNHPHLFWCRNKLKNAIDKV